MAQASGGWGADGQAVRLPTPGRRRRGVLAPVLGLVALGICGLVVLGLVGSSVGVSGVVVGALCALLPVGPVVATFLWVDRWEPEPPRLLLFAFLWGACFAALSALLINSSAALIADEVLGRGGGDALGAVAIAPVVEEAVKGAFLVGLLVFRRREFDGIVDGIVYAGLVAAGFAYTENILYIGRAFAEGSMVGQTAGVLAVLLLRGVLSPFAHPLFTAMIGIGAGIAAPSRSVAVRVVAVAIGYLLAVLLHALWNGSAALSGGAAFLGVYAYIMVPLFLIMVAVVVWQRRREQRTVTDQLPGFAAAGWIAPSEIPLLSSMAGRRGWRAAVRRRSGRKVAKAVTEYQAAVTELAFLRARIARGSVSESAPYWLDLAVAELVRARMRVVSHPEALTVAIRHHGPQGWIPPPPGPPPPAGGPGWRHPGGGPARPGGQPYPYPGGRPGGSPQPPRSQGPHP
ncbi:MAG: PrsW family intramembrane metalloprotease [Pseudonocardia sp.]